MEPHDMAALLKNLMNWQLIVDALFDLFIVCKDLVVDNLDGIGVTCIEVSGFKYLAVGASAQ